MRKLASIQRIWMIEPIEGADRIELAHVLGWQCVVNKGQFREMDLAVYFEVDSFLPVAPEFEFLHASSYRKTDIMGEGFRLRTMKFRGQISQGLLLPIIILLPFVLDYFFKSSFFTARLGKDGAKYMSSSLLIFIGGLASIYAVIIAKNKKLCTPNAIAKTFADGIKTIAPAIGVCVIGYMIGAMFTDLGVTDEMLTFMEGMSMGKFGIVVFICFITCLLGMVIPGSSLVVIFGPVFITILAAKGVNPVLAAAMLPCICGVMCGITPPLGLGMYAGMSLADSEFGPTFKNNLWWVAAQFVMEVIVLMGWLPILGL